MTNDKLTGRLENWMYEDFMMYGDVYGHALFPEGFPIHTSTVMTPKPYAKGQVIQTRNSFYLLGEPE